MKVKQASIYPREESLRVKVLRKTVPKSYFKQKARLFKVVTRDAAIQLLNEFKEATKKITIISRGKKRKNEDECESATPEKKQICRFQNYKMIAVNIMKRFSNSGGKVIADKEIEVDEKSGKVAKLLYILKMLIIAINYLLKRHLKL